MFNIDLFSEILQKITNNYDSISDFSEKSEVNRTYISKYINKKLDTPPSPKVLMKIANSSNDITTYEELMEVCGYLTQANNDLIELRSAQDTLKYENMIKNIHLNNKELDILNKIISEYAIHYNDTLSIEKNEKRALSILKIEDISDCNVSKIKKGFEIFVVSQCASVVIDGIYRRQAEIDSKYNYIETLNRLNTLSKDIEIKNCNKLFNIPILGKIAAGQPILAEEYLEGYLPVDPNIYGMTTPDDYFYLKVSGESMNLKVHNGDYALIHKQDYAENGDIIVAIINGFDEATLKKYKKLSDELVMLEPMSTYPMEPIVINLKGTKFQIIGKAIGQFGKF